MYLDNFCCGERLYPNSNTAQGDLCHQAAEVAWKNAGVLSSAKKKKAADLRIEELGAEINGVDAWLGASSLRLLKLLHATIVVLSHPFLKRKELQILCGRWVFILQFRRPGMSILNDVWALISGQLSKKRGSVIQCRREIFLPMAVAPLLHSNLGASVSTVISASDASTTGGGLCME